MAKMETTHNSSGSQWTTATIWGNALLFLLCLLKKCQLKADLLHGRHCNDIIIPLQMHSPLPIMLLQCWNSIGLSKETNQSAWSISSLNLRLKWKKKNSQQVRQTGASIASTCKLQCYCTCKPYKFRKLLIQ